MKATQIYASSSNTALKAGCTFEFKLASLKSDKIDPEPNKDNKKKKEKYKIRWDRPIKIVAGCAKYGDLCQPSRLNRVNIISQRAGFDWDPSWTPNYRKALSLLDISRGASRSSTLRRDLRNLDSSSHLDLGTLVREKFEMEYVQVRTYVRGSITVHTSIYLPYVCSYVVLT